MSHPSRRRLLKSAAGGLALVSVPGFLQACAKTGTVGAVTAALPANPFLAWFGIDAPLIQRVLTELGAQGADHGELYFQHTRSSYIAMEDGADRSRLHLASSKACRPPRRGRRPGRLRLHRGPHRGRRCSMRPAPRRRSPQGGTPQRTTRQNLTSAAPSATGMQLVRALGPRSASTSKLDLHPATGRGRSRAEQGPVASRRSTAPHGRLRGAGAGGRHGAATWSSTNGP